MKMIVRRYFNTFVDIEVDAESNEEAIEIAESRPTDSMELIENLVSTDEYDIYNSYN